MAEDRTCNVIREYTEGGYHIILNEDFSRATFAPSGHYKGSSRIYESDGTSDTLDRDIIEGTRTYSGSVSGICERTDPYTGATVIVNQILSDIDVDVVTCATYEIPHSYSHITVTDDVMVDYEVTLYDNFGNVIDYISGRKIHIGDNSGNTGRSCVIRFGSPFNATTSCKCVITHNTEEVANVTLTSSSQTAVVDCGAISSAWDGFTGQLYSVNYNIGIPAINGDKIYIYTETVQLINGTESKKTRLREYTVVVPSTREDEYYIIPEPEPAYIEPLITPPTSPRDPNDMNRLNIVLDPYKTEYIYGENVEITGYVTTATGNKLTGVSLSTSNSLFSISGGGDFVLNNRSLLLKGKYAFDIFASKEGFEDETYSLEFTVVNNEINVEISFDKDYYQYGGDSAYVDISVFDKLGNPLDVSNIYSNFGTVTRDGVGQYSEIIDVTSFPEGTFLYGVNFDDIANYDKKTYDRDVKYTIEDIKVVKLDTAIVMNLTSDYAFTSSVLYGETYVDFGNVTGVTPTVYWDSVEYSAPFIVSNGAIPNEVYNFNALTMNSRFTEYGIALEHDFAEELIISAEIYGIKSPFEIHFTASQMSKEEAFEFVKEYVKSFYLGENAFEIESTRKDLSIGDSIKVGALVGVITEKSITYSHSTNTVKYRVNRYKNLISKFVDLLK